MRIAALALKRKHWEPFAFASPSLVLIAYSAAEVLALIPLTPGGLGFVEAGLVGTLDEIGALERRRVVDRNHHGRAVADVGDGLGDGLPGGDGGFREDAHDGHLVRAFRRGPVQDGHPGCPCGRDLGRQPVQAEWHKSEQIKFGQNPLQFELTARLARGLR